MAKHLTNIGLGEHSERMQICLIVGRMPILLLPRKTEKEVVERFVFKKEVLFLDDLETPTMEGVAVRVHVTNSESCGLHASVRRRFDKVLGCNFLSRERTTFLRTPLDDRPDIYVRSVAINEPLHASFTSSLVVSFFGCP